VGDEVDRHAIADRIRALIGDLKIGRRELAQRLAVTEAGLREAIDHVAPRPSVEVLTAIVREYGVDPSWLVFGEYDSATHRVSLEAGTGFMPRDLAALASSKLRGDEPRPSFLRLDLPTLDR
jgi:transcriptional regulator with XRE-family HTH domain